LIVIANAVWIGNRLLRRSNGIVGPGEHNWILGIRKVSPEPLNSAAVQCCVSL
jgi:hypothetical protein